MGHCLGGYKQRSIGTVGAVSMISRLAAADFVVFLLCRTGVVQLTQLASTYLGLSQFRILASEDYYRIILIEATESETSSIVIRARMGPLDRQAEQLLHHVRDREPSVQWAGRFCLTLCQPAGTSPSV